MISPRLASFLICVSSLALASAAHAQVTVSEPPDLSNTFPGSAIVLGAGVNTVSGSVATPSDGQDNFQVTIPSGSQLTAVSLSLNTGGASAGSSRST